MTPELARYALVVFVLSRLGFVVVTVLATRFLRLKLGADGTFLGGWAHWDATYFVQIAQDGYQRSLPFRSAFFPLQPLATRLFTPLTAGNGSVAGIVVSNLSCFVALLGLAALTVRDFDASTARRAVLYLTIFPSALFLFAGYSESLFLALAIWCLVAMRHRVWWLAGLLGMLAALTRQIGVLLILPFAAEYAAAAGWHLRALRANVLWGLMIPAGLALYSAWLWQTVGDPLAYMHVQSTWFRVFAPPWTTVILTAQVLTRTSDVIYRFRDLVDVGAVGLMVGLVILGLRRLPLSYTLYSAAVVVVPLCSPSLDWPLLSGARLMLAAFPCLILLANEGRRRWVHGAVVLLFGVALLILTQYFVRGAVIL